MLPFSWILIILGAGVLILFVLRAALSGVDSEPGPDSSRGDDCEKAADRYPPGGHGCC